ncbi:MAG: hypothetical protein J0L73_25935 [Verrucomicrobia bacterium]|nr:hypothetical protein [Verrucomicrobiota bacterium]
MNKVHAQWSTLNLPQPDRTTSVGVNALEAPENLIVLPSGDVTISECAGKLFQRIAASKTMFLRCNTIVELCQHDHGKLRLSPIKPSAFRSRIERFGKVVAWRSGKNGTPELKSSISSESTANALMGSTEAQRLLPRISMLVDCAVAVERAGRIEVLGEGYHADESGILVAAGTALPLIDPMTAAGWLLNLLGEFHFQSASDRSRAFACLISPGLKMGGLIQGRIPIFITEADQSQAGKSYLQQITAALYNEHPTVITQKKGGVGSLDESFAQALFSGRPFIQIDNCRGKLNSPHIESFMTARGAFSARVPNQAEVEVSPEKFVVMLSSNGAETTRDLANRSCIIRILKREGFSYHRHLEGDLLEHLKHHQSWYLNCVFSVIAEWFKWGKQRTETVGHDFREWSQVLDWIVQKIGLAPLLDGHRELQAQVSNIATSFLRRLAIEVRNLKRLGEVLSATDIRNICNTADIDIPGNHSQDNDDTNRRIGVLLGQAFSAGADECNVDSYMVYRTQQPVPREGGGSYMSKHYRIEYTG